MREVKVDINAVSATEYPIIIGENILEKAQEYLARYCSASKYLIVTNDKINSLWGDKLILIILKKLLFRTEKSIKILKL